MYVERCVCNSYTFAKTCLIMLHMHLNVKMHMQFGIGVYCILTSISFSSGFLKLFDVKLI